MSNKQTTGDRLLQRIVTELNHEAGNLPPEKISAMRAIRERALQKHKYEPGFLQSLFTGITTTSGKWLAGMALATLFLALVVIVRQSAPQKTSILLTADNTFNERTIPGNELEFYEQLEFYLWLQDVSENHDHLS